MYESFFGLRQRPFDLTPDPRFVVLTESHREALNTLEYGIGARKGVLLLVGEAGSGKTTLLRAAIARQSGTVHSVHLTNPTLSRSEFVELLAARFGLSAAARASKAALLLELETLLARRAAAGETTLLVVDEAQSLPPELLEEVRLLANIESNEQKLLQVVLAGQPELTDLLEEHDLRQLKQRVALRAELGRLNAEDTAACISGRLRQAGGVPSEIFTRDAVARIHERANGLPRTMCVLADNALLAGLASGVKPVTSDLVEDVARGLGLGARAAAAAVVAFPSTAVERPAAPAALPVHDDRTAEKTPPAAPAGEDAASTSGHGELFGTFGTKRRRFVLFGN